MINFMALFHSCNQVFAALALIVAFLDIRDSVLLQLLKGPYPPDGPFFSLTPILG
jgi:hypothetical protein